MTDTAAPEPSARLRAGIAAALSRPVLLDPRAVEGVLAASAFHLRPVAGDPGAGEFARPTAMQGDVAVVSIDGPLAQRAWSCMGVFGGDGYDAIQERVQAALDSGARAVVLAIDSPGGEVAGCFECARAIRAAATAAGKPMVAYAGELAASAAYALASACDAIVCPDTAAVGSVGVIATLLDESQALAAEGVTVNLVTSGAAKADGHPALPLSVDARARVQADVDYLADVFALHVGAARGMGAPDVRALEARIFRGPHAVDAGLADRVGNLNDALDEARARASALQRKRHMKTAAQALGLPADASDDDIVKVIEARAADHEALAAVRAALLATTGAATPDEAMGTVAAWREAHAELATARAADAERAAAAQAAADAAERATLLASLTPAHRDPATPVGALVAGYSLEALRGYAAGHTRAAPPRTPPREPGPGDATIKAAAGKRWEDFKPMELHQLKAADRPAYDALLAEHRARTAR